MLKIVFYLPSLEAGGAETVALVLAKHWSYEGHNIEFIVNKKTGDLLNIVPDSIKVTSLECHKIRAGLLPLYRYFTESDADVFIAYMWPLTVVAIAAAKLARFKGKIVTSDHTTFSESPILQSSISKFIFMITTHTFYRFSDCCHIVSNGAAKDISKLSKLKKRHFTVIANPIEKPMYSLIMDFPDFWKNQEKKILAVGNLKWAKNYQLLLQAFKIFLENEAAILCIVGQGEMYDEIYQLSISLGIENYVYLVGYQSNPLAWMAMTDVLVLTSHYEGFANVIVESLSVGTPVISVDCENGPREILNSDYLGALVPNHDANKLAEALTNHFTTEYDVALLKQRSEDFSVEKIASQYMNAILSA